MSLPRPLFTGRAGARRGSAIASRATAAARIAASDGNSYTWPSLFPPGMARRAALFPALFCGTREIGFADHRVHARDAVHHLSDLEIGACTQVRHRGGAVHAE